MGACNQDPTHESTAVVAALDRYAAEALDKVTKEVSKLGIFLSSGTFVGLRRDLRAALVDAFELGKASPTEATEADQKGVWAFERRVRALATLAQLVHGEPMVIRVTWRSGEFVVAVADDEAAFSPGMAGLVFSSARLPYPLTQLRDELARRAREQGGEQEKRARELFEGVEQACSEWEGGP